MEQYSFNIRPENYQPSGCADFSKIVTPEHAIVTYTNLTTRETENNNITRTEITDENGINKFIYILPPPFVKK
jgi:hypothetical protein